MPLSLIQHPLAHLRLRGGYSHGAYARLLARTHAELGFGTTAARREKIARWESGRITPELTAQFAIAHLHGVPRDEVVRRGWPDWLHLATGQSELLDAPWTANAALAALTAIAEAEPVADERYAAVLASERGIGALISAWMDAWAAPEPQLAHGGRRIGADVVLALEQRHLGTLELFQLLGPRVTLSTAEAELRTTSRLLRESFCDQATRARLLCAAANAACLSGHLNTELGRHGRAQTLYLTALRAATAAGDGELGAWALTLFAKQEMDFGHRARVFPLIDAAREVSRRSRDSAKMSAVIDITLATTYAMCGDPDSHNRYADTALASLAAGPHDDDPPYTSWLTPNLLASQLGVNEVYMGRMERAIDRLGPVVEAATDGSRELAPGEVILGATNLARAHAQAGDADVAVLYAGEVGSYLERSPSVRLEKYFGHLRAELTRRRDVLAVREYLAAQRAGHGR